MNDMHTPHAKRWAALIGLFTLGTLLLRIYLSTVELGGITEAIVNLSRFFTIWTNCLVMVVMLRIGFGTVPASANWINTAVTSIIGVGLIYHTLLAHLIDPQGLALFADHGVHTIVPLAGMVWWICFGYKTELNFKQPFIWALWPMFYSVVTLVRSHFSTIYPYPFLDVLTYGYPQVGLNIVGLSIGFVVIGCALVLLARVLKTQR